MAPPGGEPGADAFLRRGVSLPSPGPGARRAGMQHGGPECLALRRVRSAAGHGLADAFEKHAGGLPVTFIETVRAGENSGNLDVVFSRLSTYYDKRSKSRSKVKSAMIYPSFVMGVAVIVVVVIMVMAVPTFKKTFESMGVELPLPTLVMIAVSDFMTRYFAVILGVIVGIVVAIKMLKRYNEDFMLWWSRLGTRLPVLGTRCQS